MVILNPKQQNNRKKHMTVYLTDDEKLRLEEIAESKKLSISSLIRSTFCSIKLEEKTQ